MNRQTKGRRDGRTEGESDGQTDGRTDGLTDGETDGRTDRLTEGRTDERTDGDDAYSDLKRKYKSLSGSGSTANLPNDLFADECPNPNICFLVTTANNGFVCQQNPQRCRRRHCCCRRRRRRCQCHPMF